MLNTQSPLLNSQPSSSQVLVIGAGLGGLATGLRLSHLGYNVRIVEKHNTAGGRLNILKKDGFTFDTGPSFFSMSYEFDELFRSVGEKNPLKMYPLDPLYSVRFSGKAKIYRLHKDLERLAREFSEVEPQFAAKAEKYLAAAGKIFHDTEHRIVKRNFNNLFQYVGAMASVPLRHTPKLVRSLWQELEMHFSSEEVKIIFSLVAFFLGATPFNTPAIYSLLNYTELRHDGYWNVEGGMYRITEVLLELLRGRGVEIHYNTEILGFEEKEGRLNGFRDQNGKLWEADVFVANSDAAAFRGQIMQRKAYSSRRLDKMHWTLAPFTVYLGVKGKLPELDQHNYFLGENFRDYATNILRASERPDKPYYYVNVSSRTNPGCAPEGCENLFILCPVPDLRYKSDWSDAEVLADNIIADLGKRIGADLKENTITRTIWTPNDWEKKYNLYRGSGLGLAHGLNQVGALRPANKDEKYKNLYYVGASTVPGTGLPIVVIGSRLVTERIQKDHAIAL